VGYFFLEKLLHTLDGMGSKLNSTQAREGAVVVSVDRVLPRGSVGGLETYPKNMPVGVRAAETM
jgi:hypothetical protein